jgi:hypothetical protein
VEKRSGALRAHEERPLGPTKQPVENLPLQFPTHQRAGVTR